MINKVLISREFSVADNCIKFQFCGKFTVDACNQAINEFKSKYPVNFQDFTFLWDCSQMTGFDLSARKKWSVFLKEMDNSLEKVYVLSDNIVIRGSARLLLKMLHKDGEVFKNREEIMNYVKEQALVAA